MGNSLFEPLDRKKRAEQLRKDAKECHEAGFLCLANVNWETAAMLDPWVDPEA